MLVNMNMTPDELRLALDAGGWGRKALSRHSGTTYRDFCTFTGVKYETLRTWLTGERPLTGTSAALMRIVLKNIRRQQNG